MDREKNPAQVAPVASPESGEAADRVKSQLPSSWLPDDVVLRIWARHNAGYGWETIVPEFSVAGMGDSLDAAIENVLEILDDYLVLCAREGRSFAAARRPMPVRETARLLAEFGVGRLIGKIGSGHSNRRKLDLPLHAVAPS